MNGVMFPLSAAIAATMASAPATTPSSPSAENAEFLAKNYPPEALRRGEQGKVGFQLTIDKDGTPLACTITESSGFGALDDGTCEFLVRHGRMSPQKDANGISVRSAKNGYINWKLPAGVAAAAPASAVSPNGTDPLICKRTTVPGSIIKRVKRCMTKNEWATQDRIVREETRRAMDGNTCSDHGC